MATARAEAVAIGDARTAADLAAHFRACDTPAAGTVLVARRPGHRAARAGA